MSIDVVAHEDLVRLTKHRHPASISLYVASPQVGNGAARGAVAHDTETARAKLRAAADEARAQLKELGVAASESQRIGELLAELVGDRDFWGTSARSIAVFASPDGLDAYRLRNELPSHSAVGDRYDTGPLLRATTFPHDGYVLALTEGDVRLVALESDATHRRVPLDELPDDAADVLDVEKHGGGQLDRKRADGTLGPKVEQRRYASIVRDAVLAAIGDDERPIVLAASEDLAPAYREVSGADELLDESIGANPASFDDAELAKRGREVLERHYDAVLAEWRERFRAQQAVHRATSDFDEVARHATAGQIDSLVYDLEHRQEGAIDEFGEVTVAESDGPGTYALVDEIAARVLTTGGTVIAVRGDEVPGRSPVAAILRAQQ
ncbi:MAG: hypothetical protein GXX90_01235 [Microbacteriaceae bacterium]|nr:hypothetical protein [Microbacteriaceae bacterium]